MSLFDSLDLSILAELAELQSALERTPEGGEKRWVLLQSWLKDHPNVKRHVEACTELTPASATDYLLEEISFEATGMRIKSSTIRLLARDQYDLHRPRIEAIVGQVIDLYAARRKQGATKRKKRIKA